MTSSFADPNNQNPIETQIEAAREEARRACDAESSDSSECAVAWDTVEELQAAAAHQRQDAKQKSNLSPFQVYCDENPSAPECRIYDD